MKKTSRSTNSWSALELGLQVQLMSQDTYLTLTNSELDAVVLVPEEVCSFSSNAHDFAMESPLQLSIRPTAFVTDVLEATPLGELPAFSAFEDELLSEIPLSGSAGTYTINAQANATETSQLWNLINSLPIPTQEKQALFAAYAVATSANCTVTYVATPRDLPLILLIVAKIKKLLTRELRVVDFQSLRRQQYPDV